MIKVSDLQILIKYVFRLHFVHNGQKNSQYFTAVLKYQLVRAETKALIGGGGCIFIYYCSARRISFEINGNDNWFQKKFVGQNANIWIYTPPINALVSALQLVLAKWDAGFWLRTTCHSKVMKGSDLIEIIADS